MPAEAAVAGAARLAARHRVFERPLGVAGIWGAVIRAWLDELLPPDALEHCRGRVQLVVTQVPELRCLREICSQNLYADVKRSSKSRNCCGRSDRSYMSHQATRQIGSSQWQ